MQGAKIAVFTPSGGLFEKIRTLVPAALGTATHCSKHEFERDPQRSVSGILLALVDANWDGAAALQDLLESLSKNAVHTVLILEETRFQGELGAAVNDGLVRGVIDDVLLVPLRPLELLSKVKHAHYLSRVVEVSAANRDLKTILEKIEEDIRTTRAIQQALIPPKFAPVNGIRVTHKYLSGLKSGGDYLDFFEFEDKAHLGILMSDSSAYGLSSAFLSVMLKLAMKLSRDEARSPAKTISRIFEELQLTMKPGNQLSLFYGILNRRTFEMTYAGAGSVRCLLQGKPLALANMPMEKGLRPTLHDHRKTLHPGDRLLIHSDGFAEALSNIKISDDAAELVGDLTYDVKSRLAPDDMPEQDCSVMVIDIERRAMRLAR